MFVFQMHYGRVFTIFKELLEIQKGYTVEKNTKSPLAEKEINGL